jgi:hypothetical protein
MICSYMVTFQSGVIWEVVAESRTGAIMSAAELNPGDAVVRVSQSGQW